MGDWRYELWDVAAEDVPAFFDRLRGPEFAGANVTIPHKTAAAGLVDEVDEVAARTEAVNTIVNRGGRLVGLNTDVGAIREAVREVGFETGQAVILGRGASARSAAAALDGVPTVVIGRDRWAERAAACRAADVVLNCTPLGREGEVLLEAADMPRLGVVDLVYVAGGTPLTRTAQAAGRRVVDGWSVLAAQGAAAFTAWTGRAAPLAAMRAALQG